MELFYQYCKKYSKFINALMSMSLCELYYVYRIQFKKSTEQHEKDIDYMDFISLITFNAKWDKKFLVSLYFLCAVYLKHPNIRSVYTHIYYNSYAKKLNVSHYIYDAMVSITGEYTYNLKYDLKVSLHTSIGRPMEMLQFLVNIKELEINLVGHYGCYNWTTQNDMSICKDMHDVVMDKQCNRFSYFNINIGHDTEINKAHACGLLYDKSKDKWLFIDPIGVNVDCKKNIDKFCALLRDSEYGQFDISSTYTDIMYPTFIQSIVSFQDDDISRGYCSYALVYIIYKIVKYDMDLLDVHLHMDTYQLGKFVKFLYKNVKFQ